MPKSDYDIYFDMYLPEFKRLGFICEYLFLKEEKRKHRFDAALICCKLAIEVEGGGWSGGRHASGVGFHDDMWKYNQGVIQGWHILRFTPSQIRTGKFVDILRQYLYNYPCTHQSTGAK